MESTIHREAVLDMVRKTHKPHRLCKLVDGSLWEYISLPWIEGERIWVNIRKPGDPTTLETVEAFRAHPEHMDCMCAKAEEILGSGEFYYREVPHER